MLPLAKLHTWKRTHTNTQARYHDPVLDIHLVFKFNTSEEAAHEVKTYVIISYISYHFFTALIFASEWLQPKQDQDRSRKGPLAMRRMNDHCRSSNKCPRAKEKHCICTEQWHIHKHKGLSLYAERQAHMLRAYAETCTHVKKLSLMNIHGH